MAEYIDREAALKAIAEDKIEMTPELIAIGRAIGTYTAEQAFDGINQACDRHIESIKIIPAADVVSKAAYDQVAWERHLAEVQLKSIGKSLGEKMDDVRPVVRCKDCKHFHLDYFGEVNGANIIVAHEICDLWAGGCRTTQDTFCSNGVRKDGDKNG